MNDITLKTHSRDVLGKKVRFLRREGVTPVHLFGHNLESLALQCDTGTLRQVIAKAGMTRLIALNIDNETLSRSVFIREIQRNAVSRQLLHVDLYQVRKDEKIETDVPIILVGHSPALKEKGRVLSHGITSLTVECLPTSLPPQIEVDTTVLEELEQSIHVKDIILGADVTIKSDPDQLIAKVSEVHIEVIEEEVVSEEEEEEEAAEAAEAGAVEAEGETTGKEAASSK